jgi:hypothetical protein
MARLWAKEAAPTSYSPYEPLESTATHPSPTGGGGAMAMAQPNDGRRDIFIVGATKYGESVGSDAPNSQLQLEHTTPIMHSTTENITCD